MTKRRPTKLERQQAGEIHMLKAHIAEMTSVSSPNGWLAHIATIVDGGDCTVAVKTAALLRHTIVALASGREIRLYARKVDS